MADKATTQAASLIDLAKFNPAGMNVKYHVLDGILFLAVPITEAAIKAARPSTSGKSRTLGSTLGNVSIPGTAVKVGLNVYTPNTPAIA